MDETLLALLDEVARFGTANDAKGNRAAATHAQCHAGHGSALVDPRAAGPGDAHPGGGHVERVLDDLARGCGARDRGAGGDARGRSRQGRPRAREPRPRGPPRPRRHPRGPRRGHARPPPRALRPRLPRCRSRQLRDLPRAGPAEARARRAAHRRQRRVARRRARGLRRPRQGHIPRSSRSPCPSATGKRSPTSSGRRPPRRACRCSRRPRRGRHGDRARARTPSGRCRSS